VPGSSGPPCSHARASGPSTAGGCGSGHARRPQAPIQEPPLRGQPRRGRGDGSPCGCARVSRRLQRSARRVRCPTRERGRGRARSEAPSRAAPANRRTGTAARAATQERERSRALFVVGRCSSSASSCSPFTRWAGKAAMDLRGGCRKKSRPVRRNQERQRLVGRTPLRKRTPERRTRRGSKRVKRREPRHPPELGSHRARGIDADPGC
jgi:hypothetical protein